MHDDKVQILDVVGKLWTLPHQLSNVVEDCSKLRVRNSGKLVQRILTLLGRLATDLDYLIAVGLLRHEIKLVRADSLVPEWSAL